jgi:hypothetical protein
MNTIDRRRIALASALTLAAIPALLVLDAKSNEHPGTVSADSERLGVEGDDTAPQTSAYEPGTPMFVGGEDEPTPPGVIDVAVPPAPGANEELVKASYSRYEGATGSVCTATFAPQGATLTVTNIDNGQSTRCVNTYGKRPPSGADMVLDTDVYTEIGDLSDAPIPVRVSW